MSSLTIPLLDLSQDLNLSSQHIDHVDKALNFYRKTLGTQFIQDTKMSAASEAPNRRLRIMEELDQRLDEIEEFEEYGSEYKGLLEETDLIEDENLLFELERHRRNLEKESLAGTIWEPSFVLCWVIVGFVTAYVVFLIIAGDTDTKFFKEEL